MGREIVIFDVDGNLTASLEGYLQNYLQRLKEHGLSPPELNEAEEYFRLGGPIEEQIPGILMKLGRPTDKADDLVRKWHRVNENAVYPVYPDVINALQSLKTLATACVPRQTRTSIFLTGG